MRNARPCTVAWCDNECRWEYETDGLPSAETVDDQLGRQRYLTEFGHPPFRWHSRLWPSGLCLEQNEFGPGTDPTYVAEHGRLILTEPPCSDLNPAWITPEPVTGKTAGPRTQLTVDLAEATALIRATPDRIRPETTPGAS